MKFIDINKLETYPLKKQIEIKKEIISKYDLNEIPPIYLPEVYTKEYYFVSYSHLDYKRVYSDIFDLQLEGLSIWYDRGIAAGENWKDTALKYISPYECRGVLFYISENALKSDSIKEEVEFARDTNKPFIVILLSNKNNEPLFDMISRLYKENIISKERYEFFINIFPKEVIYINVLDNIPKRAELIKNALPKQAKLDLDLRDSYLNIKPYKVNGELHIKPNGFTIYIRGLNDYYARKITIDDYLFLIKNKEMIEKLSSRFRYSYKDTPFDIEDYEVSIKDICHIYIGDAAFSNMKNLEYVEMPASEITPNIGKYAFLGCEKLKEFKYMVAERKLMGALYIGEGAFSGCKSLTEFDFEGVEYEAGAFMNTGLREIDLSLSKNSDIPKFAFYNCPLKKVEFDYFTQKIGDHAFGRCLLEELDFSSIPVEEIGEGAFYDSKRLKKVILNENIRIIGKSAFEGCDSLEEISIPMFIEEIGSDAFANCRNLKRIYIDRLSDELEEFASEHWLGNKYNDIEIIFSDKTIIEKKSEDGSLDW